jgi:hypothetical protein
MPDPFAIAMTRMFAKLAASGVEEVKSASFVPAFGVEVPCTVRLYREDNIESSDMTARVTGELLLIEYQRAEISRDAVRGESFSIDGTAYTVQAIKDRDGVSVRVVVK